MDTLIKNRYTLIQELGVGGMGAVYLAHDTVFDNKQIALKLIKKELINPTFIQNFKFEFEVMTRLKHPNLIAVYDFGLDKDTNQYYMTMEYIDGKSLATMISELKTSNEKPSVTRILDYTVQLCRALEFIHSRKIIHRDIKPANIMIAKNSIKLMDFGLADLQEKEISTKHKGTLFYMAPEILEGSISKKIDVYALGMTLFELITTNTSFMDKHSQSIISSLTNKQSYSKFSQELVESIENTSLRTIIAKMISYEPQQRYASAAEIIDDINTAFNQTYAIETEETKESYVLGAGFVGRDTELTKLKDLLQNPVAHCMIVSGDPGIGKSRLMAEFKKYCQLNDCLFIEASCFETTKKLYTPFITLINECLYHCTKATLQKHGPDLKKFFSDHELLNTIQQNSYSDIKTEHMMINKSMTELILELARDSNYQVVLYLNDIQWIDEASLEVLTKLIIKLNDLETKSTNCLKIFLSSRRDGLEVTHNLNNLSFVNNLNLQPFDKPQIELFIKAVFGFERVGNNLLESCDYINSQVGGNPFFLQEIIRSLVAANTIVHTSSCWELLCQPEEIHIPQGIGDLLLSRYKRLHLTKTEQKVVEIISLLDREISYEELNAIIPIELEVLGKLDYYEILKKEIIEERLFFRINHCLIQEIINSNNSDVETVHTVIAEKLEQIHATELDEYCNALTHHFFFGNNKEKALKYGERAIEKALAHFEISRASGLCDKLLSLCDIDDTIRMKLLYSKLLVYNNFFNLKGMEDISVELIKLADQLQNKKCRAQCYCYLGEAHYRADQKSIKALEYYEKSLADFIQIDEKYGIATLLNLLGAYYSAYNDFSKALDFHHQSLKIAEAIGNELIIAYNTGNIGLIHFNKGEYKQALTTITKSLAIVTQLNNKPNIAMGNRLAGEIYFELEDYQKALEFFDRAIATSQEIEHYLYELSASHSKVQVLLELGMIEQAEQLHNETDTLIKKISPSEEMIFGMAILAARIEYAKKNTLKAIDIVQQLCHTFKDHTYLPTIKYTLWKFSGDETLRQECIALYKDLYIKTPKFEFKKRIDEFELKSPSKISHPNDGSAGEIIDQTKKEINDIKIQLDEIQDIFQHNDLSVQFKLNETNEFIFNKILEISNKFKHLQFSNSTPQVDPKNELTRVHFFQRLLDIIHDMNSNLSLNTLLDKILDASIQLMGAERGVILLQNAEKTLEHRTSRNNKKEYIKKNDLKISQTIVQKALSNQEAVFVANVADHVDLSLSHSITDLELRSVMCSPIGRKSLDNTVEKRKYPFLSTCQRLGIIYIDSTVKTQETNFIGSNLQLFQVLVDQASIAILNAMLYESVNVDKLTGLFLRSFFEINLEHELEYCHEIKSFCSVVMIDIDFFKMINDRHGHQTGDEVLRLLGKLLKTTLRNTDICGRYGGEEFIIILPNTDLNQVVDVAQKIQKKISETSFPCGRLTISIGISCFPQHVKEFVKDETRILLIKNADQALYFAKHNGRNRYEVWNDAMQSMQLGRITAKEILTGNPIRDYRNVEMLLTVIQTIANHSKKDDILCQVIDLILKTMEADRGIILSKNEITPSLDPIICRTKDGTILDTSILRYSKKIVDMVFVTGKEICINAIEEEFESQSIADMEVKSIMCVALHQNNHRIGVFYLDSKKQIKEFSSTELSFFSAIAAQISMLLQLSTNQVK